MLVTRTYVQGDHIGLYVEVYDRIYRSVTLFSGEEIATQFYHSTEVEVNPLVEDKHLLQLANHYRVSEIWEMVLPASKYQRAKELPMGNELLSAHYQQLRFERPPTLSLVEFQEKVEVEFTLAVDRLRKLHLLLPD